MLIVVRHGQTWANRVAVIQGTDRFEHCPIWTALTIEGFENAKSVGAKVSDVLKERTPKILSSRVLCPLVAYSPTPRAVQTASILCDQLRAHGIRFVLQVDNQLLERSYGPYEGHVANYLEQEDLRRRRITSGDKNFESSKAIHERTRRTVTEYTIKEQEYPVILVTHGVTSCFLDNHLVHDGKLSPQEVEDSPIPDSGQIRVYTRIEGSSLFNREVL